MTPMHPVVLRTERLLLDAVLESDIDDIERYCQDPLFEEYLTIPWPGQGKHPSRDGETVQVWQGTLRVDDARSEKPGWPV